MYTMARVAAVDSLQRNDHYCEQASTVIPCFRCGISCTRHQVRLDMIEAKRIADGSGLALEIFADTYLDQHHPEARSFLIRQRDGACVFLKRVKADKRANCLIHSFKPSACREWTPSLYRRECPEGLVRHWGVTVNSSGQLHGPEEATQAFRLFLESLAKTEEVSYK